MLFDGAQFMFEQVSLCRNPYLDEKVSRIQLPSSNLLRISSSTSRIQPTIILHQACSIVVPIIDAFISQRAIDALMKLMKLLLISAESIIETSAHHQCQCCAASLDIIRLSALGNTNITTYSIHSYIQARASKISIWTRIASNSNSSIH